MAKRIKRVFSSADQVIHLWANQTQSDARSANVFFEGCELYSYGRHYLLGLLVNYKGTTVALVNDDRYSKTTSKHTCWTKSAVSHMPNFFMAGGRTDDERVKLAVERAERELCEQLRDHFCARKFTSWGAEWNRWVSKEDNTYHVREDIKTHNEFCAQLGFTKNQILPTVEFIEAYDAHIDFCVEREAARVAKFNSPDEIAKREAKAKRAQELALIKAQVAIENWRAGGATVEAVRALSPMLLRINGDEVETSRGARVPVDHALRLLRLVEARSARQGERVGHFTLDNMNDETVTIGCHVISIAEARAVLSQVKPKLELVKTEAV